MIDILCPFGKGQRALIVAPAKAGKTMVLQAIAEGIAANYPQATLFILLVDERPEEVFEMEATGRRRGDRVELRQPGRSSTSRWPS